MAQDVPHRDPVVRQQPGQIAVDRRVEFQLLLVDQLEQDDGREGLGDAADSNRSVSLIVCSLLRSATPTAARYTVFPSSIRAMDPGAPCAVAECNTPSRPVRSTAGAAGDPAWAGTASRGSRTAPATVPTITRADAIRLISCRFVSFHTNAKIIAIKGAKSDD